MTDALEQAYSGAYSSYVEHRRDARKYQLWADSCRETAESNRRLLDVLARELGPTHYLVRQSANEWDTESDTANPTNEEI